MRDVLLYGRPVPNLRLAVISLVLFAGCWWAGCRDGKPVQGEASGLALPLPTSTALARPFRVAPSSRLPVPSARREAGLTAHWRVERTGAFRLVETIEVWFNPGKLRVKASRDGRVQHALVSGENGFEWEEGESSGTMVLHYQAEPIDLTALRRFSDLELSGEKTGSEDFEGERCDLYEFFTGPASNLTVWVSPGRVHAVKEVFQDDEESVSITNLQIPSEIPGSVFEPPESVRFVEQKTLRMKLSASALGADRIILGRPDPGGPARPSGDGSTNTE